MSNQNRHTLIHAWQPTGGALLVQEIDAPDGSGTYLMVGVQTAEGRLGVILPYRNIEALGASMVKNAVKQSKLVLPEEKKIVT